MALLPVLLCACKSNDPDSLPKPAHPGGVTSLGAIVSRERKVDILFVVDNSSSMDPKQEALAKALPKMMSILQSLPTGAADLHIGVISSDMGAGPGEGVSGCATGLGNRGILWGNDPNADPEAGNNTYATVKEIRNSAGITGCGLNAGARWIEDIEDSNAGGRRKNYQGDLSDVLSCLTKAVGVGGCGFEHQLASLRQALNPVVGDGNKDAINPQNVGFIRPKAYLAIVLVSDEDDCSADPSETLKDGMFAAKTPGDTVSLRCAARGHVCNDRDIPDYYPQTGYAGKEPFVSKFSACAAKDTTNPAEFPLIRIRDLIDGVSGAKARPEEMIRAYGIIGWPERPEDAEYRIDKDPTAQPSEQQKLWDYMPICKVSEVKSADGNIYKAYGGLRLKKFLDAYKDASANNVFSICNQDFSDAMTKIGKAIGGIVSPRLGCGSVALADADPDLAGIQPECRAVMGLSCDSPGKGDCRANGYTENPIEQCRDGEGHPLDLENPQTDKVGTKARPCWYLHQDRSESGCGEDPLRMRPKVLAVDGQPTPAGALLTLECAICPDGQPGCPL